MVAVTKSTHLLPSSFSAKTRWLYRCGEHKIIHLSLFVSYTSLYHNLQVRATNFSTTGEFQTYAVLSKESLCNSTRNSERSGFTTLSVTGTQQGFSVGLQYENEPRTDQMIASGSGQPLGDVIVYFGGLPSKWEGVVSEPAY